MVNHIDISALSPEEKAYNEFMEQADNFMKIEIYRNAKKWYQKALAINLHNDEVTEKLLICNKSLKKETRSILVITVLVCIVTGAVIIYKLL